MNHKSCRNTIISAQDNTSRKQIAETPSHVIVSNFLVIILNFLAKTPDPFQIEETKVLARIYL